MLLPAAFTRALACALGLAQLTAAIQLDVGQTNSIKQAAATAAWKMMTLYPGNKTGGIPGLLGEPYYWWEAGAMFGSMIDYWYYTGDTSYNNVTTEAMLFQVGESDDYMPRNQTKSLGNDDQAFWGVAAMRAAEVNYPNPPADKPQWLALAQAVFNTQAVRWNIDNMCGGGLKWQIYHFNNGYTYRNSISNGLFFNLGARLAAYTGNMTYADWAVKAWDWSVAIGLIDHDWDVYDGTDDTKNCTELDRTQWTYNPGVYLYGAATMWNITQDDKWKQRTLDLWNRTSLLFYTGSNNQILYEAACEPYKTCKVDQLSFKGYLSRWLSTSCKVAPWLHDSAKPFMVASAQAAAQSCVGGNDGITCGTRWDVGGWDGDTGVGQQMCALETIQALLADYSDGPHTHVTGTSKGNPAAGQPHDDDVFERQYKPITTADRAGAWILTILFLAGTLAGAWWLTFL